MRVPRTVAALIRRGWGQRPRKESRQPTHKARVRWIRTRFGPPDEELAGIIEEGAYFLHLRLLETMPEFGSEEQFRLAGPEELQLAWERSRAANQL